MLMAEEKGLSVNQADFEEAQQASKEASKGAGKKGDGQSVKLDVHDLGVLGDNVDVPKTDDSFKYSELNACGLWELERELIRATTRPRQR